MTRLPLLLALFLVLAAAAPLPALAGCPWSPPPPPDLSAYASSNMEEPACSLPPGAARINTGKIDKYTFSFDTYPSPKAPGKTRLVMTVRDAEGKVFPAEMTAFFVTGPEKAKGKGKAVEQRVSAQREGGAYAGDADLTAKGKYKIMAKTEGGTLMLEYEFTHQVK